MAFNVSRVIDAIVASHVASWVIVLTEERSNAPRADGEKLFDRIVEGIDQRVENGDLDVSSARTYKSQAKTMMLCKLETLLDAVAEGYGINGVLQRIRAVEGKRSNAGRKAGQGAGKTTAPKDDADDALPEVSPLPKEWLRFLDGMRARVPALKTWTASDIAAFQDSSAQLIALIKRNS